MTTYGGLVPLYVKLLGDPGETCALFSVFDGVFPADEELHKFDGFMVTGSRHDAHGSADWRVAREFICRCFAQRIMITCHLSYPLATIVFKIMYTISRYGLFFDNFTCSFQNQEELLYNDCVQNNVISCALGGKIGRAPAGWEVGLKKIDILDALLSKPYGLKLPRTPSVIEAHQDQVFEIPPGGELLASSENTGIEIFAVEDHVLRIQGHPEFTEDILSNILDFCSSQGIITEELIFQARTSIKEGAPDQEILQRLCKVFLKGCSHGYINCKNDYVQGS